MDGETNPLLSGLFIFKNVYIFFKYCFYLYITMMFIYKHKYTHVSCQRAMFFKQKPPTYPLIIVYIIVIIPHSIPSNTWEIKHAWEITSTFDDFPGCKSPFISEISQLSLFHCRENIPHDLPSNPCHIPYILPASFSFFMCSIRFFYGLPSSNVT